MENNIPLSLISDFKKNKVILFLGAGISINAGLPSWGDLLTTLSNKFVSSNEQGSEFYRYCDYPEKAQILYDTADRISVLNEISDIFTHNSQNIDSSILDKIASLPVDTIITTNWDNLLENSFTKKNIAFNKIWKDDQISSTNFVIKNIIKLHGTIEDLSSIVFSDDDYNNFFFKNQLLKNYLSIMLSRSTILMVGYSYKDATFKSITNLVQRCLENTNRIFYTLQLNPEAERISYLKKRGLHCIVFWGENKAEALSNFFDKLYEATSIYAEGTLDRMKLILRENKEILDSYNGVKLRNLAALGPLATPLEPKEEKIFGESTELEILCAKNWLSILDQEKSTAKLILCVNESESKEKFTKSAYLERINTLIKNIEKYKDKIIVVDSGSPLIINHYDIYGNHVYLESLKTNVNNRGYNILKVHKTRNKIDEAISVFDQIFKSVWDNNLIIAQSKFSNCNSDEECVRRLVLDRLNSMKQRIESDW